MQVEVYTIDAERCVREEREPKYVGELLHVIGNSQGRAIAVVQTAEGLLIDVPVTQCRVVAEKPVAVKPESPEKATATTTKK